eukprot:gi/632964781/ref/XP_007898564.1/ PREDICTED: nuclear pore complex protein Nup214 [Callorhinchus milii]
MGDDLDGVPEREMKDFQFKQMKKIRVFESPDELLKDRVNLLAVSNKFGLTFAGGITGLRIFNTRNIILAGRGGGDINEIVEGVHSMPVATKLPLHHIALSSDDLTLSVCMASADYGLIIAFFDVRTFVNKARQQKRPFAYHKLSKEPNCLVVDLKWSPTAGSVLAVCLSDGSVIMLDVTDTVKECALLPPTAAITSVCWSPKGKQLAAGRQNGTVIQFSPALQEKKVIPCPPFYDSDNPVKVLDVCWISTYVFAVAYTAADGSLETPPEVVIVSLPKKDEKREDRFLNFTDLCFGVCAERQHHYYLQHIEDWDLLLASSAASIEVTTVARQADKTNWELWVLEDAARAELPVTEFSADTMPVGVAIDFTSQLDIPISDEKTLPPAPVLMLLSTDGVLCPYYMINQNPGLKSLITPAQNLCLDGERQPKSAPLSSPATTASSMLPKSELSAAESSAPAPAFTQPPVPTGPAFTQSPVLTGPASSQPAVATGPVFSQSAIPVVPAFTQPPVSTAPAFTRPAVPYTSTPAVQSRPATESRPAGTSVAPMQPMSFKMPSSSVKTNLNARLASVETTPQAAGSSSALSFTPKATFGLGSSFGSSAALPARPETLFQSPGTTVASTRTALNASATASVSKLGSTHQASASSVEKPLQQRQSSDPVMMGILEEIALFQKELDEVKARTASARCEVGSSQEMKMLKCEAETIHSFLLEIKETTESLHGDISTLKTTMLEGFAGVEDARTHSERNRDSNYLQLLCIKPLDPKSEAQLKEIRRLHQYVKFAVQDVNDVLDLEWEQYQEKNKKQKHLILPEREVLFNALAGNREIINQQSKRLNQLINGLQQLRMYNETSKWSVTHESCIQNNHCWDTELETLRNVLVKTKLESTPKMTPNSPAKPSPLKQSQLRNFLSKRQTPPVRSTAPANLSRSAFLSPKYYEELEDVSSTSSVSQPLENEELQLQEQDEQQQEHVPLFRHSPVARMPSFQPALINAQSTPFSKPQSALGPSLNLAPKPVGKPMEVPDTFTQATKTVKHGAPAEKPATSVPPAQAAAAAALRRQTANQTPVPSACLTEPTLKNVPKVVNVQGLKDMGPPLNLSTVISPSAPTSAAGIVQQALAANLSKQGSQTNLKGSPLVGLTVTGQASSEAALPSAVGFSFANSTGSLGQTLLKSDTGIVMSITVTSAAAPGPAINKAFTFPSAGGFSFTSPATCSSTPTSVSITTTPGASANVKDPCQASQLSFGGSSKPVFALGGDVGFPFASPKPPASSTVSAESVPNPPSASSNNNSSAEVQPVATGPSTDPGISSKPDTQKPKPENNLFQGCTTGVTIGSFSGLVVNPTDDPSKADKPSQGGYAFRSAAETSTTFSFGSVFPAGKSEPVDVVAGAAAASAGAPKATGPLFNSLQTTGVESPDSTSDGSLPAGVGAPGFVFKLEQLGGPAPGAASPVGAALAPDPSFPEQLTSPAPEAADPPVASAAPKAPPPEEKEDGTGSVSAVPALESRAAEPSRGPASDASAAPSPAAPPSATATGPPALPPTAAPSAAAVLVGLAEPVAAPVTSHGAAPPAAAPTTTLAPAALPPPPPPPAAGAPAGAAEGTAAPGPLFGAGATHPASGVPLFAQPPTSAAGATVFGQPASAGTVTAPVFGLPAAAGAPGAFGQITAGSATAPGAPSFGSAGGFGKPAFGQPPSSLGFGQTGSNPPASAFGFGHSVFGSAPVFGQPTCAAAPAPSGGPFSGASAFSFEQTAGGGGGGGGVFAQSSGPAFGQSTGFPQAPVFGSSTATTSSAGFGFVQPSGFGAPSSGTVFGQQPNTGSVFGQVTSTGTGGFGSGAGGGGFFSGLGGKPSQDAANKNPFGQLNFGSAESANSPNLFGNSGAKTFGFGNSSFGTEQKSSGLFSAGSSVASQGFGSFASPTKPAGGFGAAPVFGSPPAFGGAPSFGGSLAFGGAPAFTSPLGSSAGKVFGEGTAAASAGGFGFGSSSNAPTFGSLANQPNAATFGSISQQRPGFGAQGTSFSGFGSTGGGFGSGFGSPNQSNQSFSGWRG